MPRDYRVCVSPLHDDYIRLVCDSGIDVVGLHLTFRKEYADSEIDAIIDCLLEYKMTKKTKGRHDD